MQGVCKLSQALPRAWLQRLGLLLCAIGACHQTGDDDSFDHGSMLQGGSAGTAATASAAAASDAIGGAVDVDENLGGTAQGGTSTTSGGAPSAAAGEAGASDTGPANGGACGSGADDGACASCLQAQCCGAWQACEQDQDCTSCSACLDAEMDLGTCVVMNLCNIAPQATAELLLCGLEPCVSECGFD